MVPLTARPPQHSLLVFPFQYLRSINVKSFQVKILWNETRIQNYLSISVTKWMRKKREQLNVDLMLMPCTAEHWLVADVWCGACTSWDHAHPRCTTGRKKLKPQIQELPLMPSHVVKEWTNWVSRHLRKKNLKYKSNKATSGFGGRKKRMPSSPIFHAQWWAEPLKCVHV